MIPVFDIHDDGSVDGLIVRSSVRTSRAGVYVVPGSLVDVHIGALVLALPEHGRRHADELDAERGGCVG